MYQSTLWSLWVSSLWFTVCYTVFQYIQQGGADHKESCPLESDKTCTQKAIQRDNTHYAEVGDVSKTSFSSLSLSHQPQEEEHDQATRRRQEPCRFLGLPGEVRNLIYRLALLSDKSFAVQLQFGPLDAALLRVNKQIFAETSSIFYHESVFRFPPPLFVGPLILNHLEQFYRLSQVRLRTMRNFIFEVPVSIAVSC